MCGVGASASMLARYGISIGRLLGTAGPEVFVDCLVKGLTRAHGQVSPHFFPFGGIAPSLEWWRSTGATFPSASADDLRHGTDRVVRVPG